MNDKSTEPMTTVEDMNSLVVVQPESTISRTILKSEGTRLVLFGFAKGQVLTEHTAAVPVLLQALSGELVISADGRSDILKPGGVIHLGTRVPHAVEALTDSVMLLTMLDGRKTIQELTLQKKAPENS